MAADHELDKDNVTLVTRNNKWAIADMLLAVAYVYYITHPEVADQIAERLQIWREKIAYRISVQHTIQAIRSLPSI